MWLGLLRITAKLNRSDEFALYAETDTGCVYHIFCNDDLAELVRGGTLMARILGVPFRNSLNYDYSEKTETFDISNIHVDLSKDAGKKKPKRVTGVAKFCRPLIQEGKTNEQIMTIMLPKYLEAGRTEKVARELLIPYLSDMRQGKC